MDNSLILKTVSLSVRNKIQGVGSVMWKYLIMDFPEWQPQKQVCSPVLYRSSSR